MKHTPEPWIITREICSNCHDGTVGVTRHTDNGNYDGEKDCPDCHGKGLKLFIQGKTDSAYFSIAEVAGPSNLDRLDELQANACLIAAAPHSAVECDRLKEINAELLALCKSALTLVEELGEFPQFASDLRDAINKATTNLQS